MWTVVFWRAAGERALKSFAQSLLAAVGVAQTGVLDVDWRGVLSVAVLAGVLSVVTSVASSKVGGPGPSLGTETIAHEPEHRAEAGQFSPMAAVGVVVVALTVVLLFLLTPLNWGHG